jgi:hypothetical protein
MQMNMFPTTKSKRNVADGRYLEIYRILSRFNHVGGPDNHNLGHVTPLNSLYVRHLKLHRVISQFDLVAQQDNYNLGKGTLEPSSGGSFVKFIFIVRSKPSFGGSRICTTGPYAAFIASIAPRGSPSYRIASGDGRGNATDRTNTLGFRIENWNQSLNSLE